jgi:hypothetical protein
MISIICKVMSFEKLPSLILESSKLQRKYFPVSSIEEQTGQDEVNFQTVTSLITSLHAVASRALAP